MPSAASPLRQTLPCHAAMFAEITLEQAASSSYLYVFIRYFKLAQALLCREYIFDDEITMSWIENTFSYHENALMLRAQRAETLAANLANADTPGFKARDIEFKSILGQQLSNTTSLATSNNKHISMADIGSPEKLYRLPTRPFTNGNTVETEVEKAAFTENAIHYQASLQFLDGKIKGLLMAIRGE